MKKRNQIAWVSVLTLSLAACGAERTPAPNMYEPATVTAARSLGTLEEARKIEADMDREMRTGVGRPYIALSQTRLQPMSPSAAIQKATFLSRTRRSSTAVNKSLLLRTQDSLRAYALTGGLREGVYVMWWVIFNNPRTCSDPIPDLGARCGGGDGSDLELGDTSIYWATGAVVGSDGFGLFHTRTTIHDELGVPGEQFIRGRGLTDPYGAEVHLVIKYVGPAAADVETLSRQLITIPEDCRNFASTTTVDGPGSNCRIQHVAVHTAWE